MRLNRQIGMMLAIVVGIWMAPGLKAADNNGMSFLKLPVDARSAAMGEAATVLGGDAAVAFRNPAGLGANAFRSLVLMHNAYLADIAQEFAAFQFLAGKHNLAISLNFMNIPGIEIRGVRPTEKPDGETEAMNFAFGLSYAYRYDAHWAFGATLKYLFEKYFMASASGMAVDLGVLRHDVFLRGLDWGMSLQNLGRMQKLKTERTSLPVIWRSGLQYPVATGWTLLPQVVLAADLDYWFNQGAQVRFGTEVPVGRMLFLRAGSIFSSQKTRLSMGFGLAYKNYRMHYAFSSYPYQLGNSHRFSLSWQF